MKANNTPEVIESIELSNLHPFPDHGQHWHNAPKSSCREKDKFNICTQKGIFLIRITDGNVLKPENCNHVISTIDGIDNAIKELGKEKSLH